MLVSDAGRLNVFISYSRDDIAFADQLDATLQIGGFATTLDRHGIDAGEDWKTRLGALIRDADTVAFVLTSASARSTICAWEVEEAVRLSKRILPVVPGPLEGTHPPPGLAALNYILFYPEPKKPGSGFGPGLLELVAALKTDLAWLREHTRLLQRATEWETGSKPTNRLLSGSDITAAKAWAARRPKDAPALTGLHLDYIKASEEWETLQNSKERERLQQMADAQAARELALAEKEAAQEREAKQARRVVRRTLAGLFGALALAGVAAAAGWNAHLRRLEVEQQKSTLAAANQRLGAEMKLRIAPFGTQAYSISENWYKLATTNASSIAFIERKPVQEPWHTTGTGFLIQGKELYEPWGDDLYLMTASHVMEGDEERRAYFPVFGHQYKVKLSSLVWSRRGTDVAVVRLEGPLPPGARYVEGISNLDVTKWSMVKFLTNNGSLNNSGGQFVEGSALSNVVPLITLGVAIENYDYKSSRPFVPVLALSLANGLGRNDQGKIIFTDSTTQGSSGSPVFDANDGKLVAIVQFGSVSTDPPPKDALRFSGGVSLTEVKKDIRETLKDPLEWGRWLLENGHDDKAKNHFEIVLARDPTAASRIKAVSIDAYIKRAKTFLGNNNEAEARALFNLAVTVDPAASAQIREAFVDTYIGRGIRLLDDNQEAEANALFELALDRDPTAGTRIRKAWVDAYTKRARNLLRNHKDADADKLFELALRKDPEVTKNVQAVKAQELNNRARRLFMVGKFNDALPDAEIAVALAPGVNTLDTRGQIYLGLGRIEAALSDFDKAIAGGINDPGTYYGRGRAHELKGNRDAAVTDYTKALELKAGGEYGRSVHENARERLSALSASGAGDPVVPNP
jgi:tetratricopeptide (TPR) repeat protein/S1-C subfamily serine protease